MGLSSNLNVIQQDTVVEKIQKQGEIQDLLDQYFYLFLEKKERATEERIVLLENTLTALAETIQQELLEPRGKWQARQQQQVQVERILQNKSVAMRNPPLQEAEKVFLVNQVGQAPSSTAVYLKRCRRCKSTAAKRSRRSGLTEQLLTVTPVRPYRCKGCGHRFLSL